SPRLARNPAAHLLDHDRLGPAMAEALAHHAGLGAARFQRQRLGRGDAQLLFAGFFGRFGHFRCQTSDFPPRSRKQSRRAARAKKALLPGPESRAACPQFDRPNAKSNCADVKLRQTVTGGRWSSSRRSKTASFLTPSGAASEARIRPTA